MTPRHLAAASLVAALALAGTSCGDDPEPTDDPTTVTTTSTSTTTTTTEAAPTTTVGDTTTTAPATTLVPTTTVTPSTTVPAPATGGGSSTSEERGQSGGGTSSGSAGVSIEPAPPLVTPDVPTGDVIADPGPDYWAPIMRTFVVNGRLWALSGVALSGHDPLTLAETAWVQYR